MIGRCHDDSLVGRSPGGRLAVSARWPKGHCREFSVMPAKRAPPGHRMDACGWPLDHLPICIPQLFIVMWSLGHRQCPCDHPAIIHCVSLDCSVYAYFLCCFMLLCCYVYITYWMTLNNKNKVLVMLLIYYFLSCIVLPCVYQKYYYWNKCFYVFSVLLTLNQMQ